MKKLIAIALALLLFASCGSVRTDNPAVKDTNESTKQTENTESIPDDNAVPSEVVYWQREGSATNCSLISGNIYSVEDEIYIVGNPPEPITKTSAALDLSGETVEIDILKDANGELKHLVFSGANRGVIRILDNKAFIVDYYANQIFVFDAATNSVTPILSDKAYGFGCDEYEILTGKYDKISWLQVPAVNNKGDRIVYWSNKYADNGVMSLNPGIWIVDLQAGSEYRLDLGELVPTVGYINWIDDETIMFDAEGGDYYKLNIVSNELETLNLPADTAIAVSNGYAVYKTDNAVYVNDLTKNTVTEYTVTEPVSFDKVFERNGIIAFSSLRDGSVWTIENESKSLNTYKIALEENQGTFLQGWSEDGLVVEILDIVENQIVKIFGIPIEGSVQ